LSYSNALFEKELKDIEDAMLQLSSPAPDVHMGDPVMTLKKQLVLATITAAFATSQGDMGQTRHLEGQREVPGRLPQGDRSRQGRRRYQGRGRVQDRQWASSARTATQAATSRSAGRRNSGRPYDAQAVANVRELKEGI
jgi:hypothetical protein